MIWTSQSSAVHWRPKQFENLSVAVLLCVWRRVKIDFIFLGPPNLHNTLGVFCNIISYFTCFHLTNFFGEEKFSWLPSKNKVAEENFHFQRHTNFLVKTLQSSVFLISHFFRRQPAERFFSNKIHQMKAGKNNKYCIKKTLGLCRFEDR